MKNNPLDDIHLGVMIKFGKQIDELPDEELFALYDFIHERVKLRHKIKSAKELSLFYAGQLVKWEHDGKEYQGHIVRVNQHTLTIRSTDGGKWKIDPQFVAPVHKRN